MHGPGNRIDDEISDGRRLRAGARAQPLPRRRSNDDEIEIRDDVDKLPTVAPRQHHVVPGRPAQPPEVAVGEHAEGPELGVGLQMGPGRLVDPIRRDDDFSAGTASLKDELADLRRVPRSEIEPRPAVRYASVVQLPGSDADAERGQEVRVRERSCSAHVELKHR